MFSRKAMNIILVFVLNNVYHTKKCKKLNISLANVVIKIKADGVTYNFRKTFRTQKQVESKNKEYVRKMQVSILDMYHYNSPSRRVL